MLRFGSVTITSVVLLATSVAHAQRPERINQMVAPSVTAVISDPTNNLRLVVGRDNGAYLGIERIDNNSIAQQSFVRRLTMTNGAEVDIAEFDALTVTAFANRSVSFDAIHKRYTARCTGTIASGRGNRLQLQTQCTGGEPVVPGPVNPPPLGACTTKRSGPTGGTQWSRGLSTDLDMQLLGVDIKRYRILWDNNQWTAWFTPGADDRDGTRNYDGSERRVWAYFADHTFEYEVCPFPGHNPPGTGYLPPPVNGGPSHGGAYQPTVRDLEQATATCKQTYTFASDVESCVTDTVALLGTPYRASAFAVVPECARVFPFSGERKDCRQIALRSTREPVELIAYCGKNFTFSSERLDCLRKWSK